MAKKVSLIAGLVAIVAAVTSAILFLGGLFLPASYRTEADAQRTADKTLAAERDSQSVSTLRRIETTVQETAKGVRDVQDKVHALDVRQARAEERLDALHLAIDRRVPVPRPH